MKRRRESLSVFSLSFLDLLTCALGAVLVLLMLVASRTEQQALAYHERLAELDDSAAAAASELDAARALGAEAAAARDRAEQLAGAESKARQAADADRRAAEERARQAAAAGERAEELAGAESKARRAADNARQAAQTAMAHEKDARSRAETAAQAARDAADRSRNDAIKAQQDAAQAAADRQRAQQELATTKRQLAEAQSRIQHLHGVVGLRGKLRRVVFVFDTSASLGQSDLPPSASPAAIEQDKQRKRERFAEYKGLLSGWIRGLDMEAFNVIAFNNEITVWRADAMTPGTAPEREAAVQVVAAWQPAGTTNTLGALHAALRLPGVDTIVLFSDGQPNDPRNEPVSAAPRTPEEIARSQAAVRHVLREVAAANLDPSGSPRVTINAVAMGNYLNQDYGRFLQDLARQNGGEFIGR